MTHLPIPVPTDPVRQPDRRSPRGGLRWVTSRFRPIAPANRNGRLLLIGPTLVAVLLLAVIVYLTGSGITSDDVRESVVLGYLMYVLAGFLYNLLPALAMAALISVASRRMAKGMPSLAVGTAAFTVVNAFLLSSMLFDDSSTGVLLFLFLPIYSGALVIIIGLVTLLVHNLRVHQSDPLPK